ncbi:MAG: terpene cyclase/mutase family protein [Nitrospirales bacterium]|nr:terpene cyclase/mutase family protein [Nitrospirales bacterium]
MIQEPLLQSLELLQSIQLPNGGFPYHSGEKARPDATAWAIIALSSYAVDRESCNRGRAYLASQQANDGRVSLSPSHPEASWPTPLAIFAWEGVPQYQEAQSRAVDYLIGFTGQHFSNPDPSIIGHDTTILGWPWIADTHSWVVPTALALLALHKVGLGTHPRVIAGQQMLLNRQLPSGGWNYGSTTVFNRELPPLPECTAIALQALADNIAMHEIERSLQYLSRELPQLRTPISLGWTLLGIGAWGLKPTNTEELVSDCFHRQERYGPYALPSLALLLCAVKASHGLHSLFRSLSEKTHAASAHD